MKSIALLLIFGLTCTGCSLGKPTDVLLIRYDDNSMIKGQVIKTNASVVHSLYDEN